MEGRESCDHFATTRLSPALRLKRPLSTAACKHKRTTTAAKQTNPKKGSSAGGIIRQQGQNVAEK